MWEAESLGDTMCQLGVGTHVIRATRSTSVCCHGQSKALLVERVAGFEYHSFLAIMVSTVVALCCYPFDAKESVTVIKVGHNGY